MSVLDGDQRGALEIASLAGYAETVMMLLGMKAATTAQIESMPPSLVTLSLYTLYLNMFQEATLCTNEPAFLKRL